MILDPKESHDAMSGLPIAVRCSVGGDFGEDTVSAGMKADVTSSAILEGHERSEIKDQRTRLRSGFHRQLDRARC